MNSVGQDYNDNAYQEHNGNERSNVGNASDGNGPRERRVSNIGSGVHMAIVRGGSGSTDVAQK